MTLLIENYPGIPNDNYLYPNGFVDVEEIGIKIVKSFKNDNLHEIH